jgi:hypothetical protein
MGESASTGVGKVEVALAFGRAAKVLLGRFDAAYGYAYEHGWVPDFDDVATASFPPDEMPVLRASCSGALNAIESRRFRGLQFHGPEFLTLLSRLTEAEPTECLESLLNYHRSVQRSRRGGGAWLQQELGKIVVQARVQRLQERSGFSEFQAPFCAAALIDMGSA